MRVMLWSVLQKDQEGQVIKHFAPSHLLSILADARPFEVDTIILYEVPLTYGDPNGWKRLQESLQGNWNAYVRGSLHYDWGFIYLSKMDLDFIITKRFNSDDVVDFDYLDPAGRTAVTLIQKSEQEGSNNPNITLFHANPNQNAALRLETVDEILSTIPADVPHLLVGNLIDNKTDGQLYNEILKPQGFETAFEIPTMPGSAPEFQADCIFVRNIEVKESIVVTQKIPTEHRPVIVDIQC